MSRLRNESRDFFSVNPDTEKNLSLSVMILAPWLWLKVIFKNPDEDFFERQRRAKIRLVRATKGRGWRELEKRGKFLGRTYKCISRAEDQTIWRDGEKNGALHFVAKTVDKSRRFLWPIPSEGLPFLSTDPRVLNNSFLFPYGAPRVRYRNFFFRGRLMHPLLPSTKRQKIPLVSLQLIPILEEACIMEINTRERFVFAVSDSPGKRTAERSDVEAVAIFSSSSFSFFFLSFFSM